METLENLQIVKELKESRGWQWFLNELKIEEQRIFEELLNNDDEKVANLNRGRIEAFRTMAAWPEAILVNYGKNLTIEDDDDS